MSFLKFTAFVAHALTESLINSLWQGILLIAAIGLVFLIFRTLNAATRHLILCLALIALVFLPFVGMLSIVESLDNILPGYTTDQFGIAGHDIDNSANPSATTNIFYKVLNIPVPSEIPLILIMILWISVIFFMLHRLIRGLLYIRKLKQNMLTFPSKYYHIFEGALKSADIKRKVSIYTSYKTKMPMAIGLINPIILIPNRVLDKLTEEQLSYVILHELAHIKRWDDWTNLAQKIMETFYFWHPAIFWVRKQLNLYREIACDDYVITLSNEPKSYARCLARLIELNIATSRQTMATGVAWHKKHITKRLKKIIKSDRDKSSRLSTLAISLAIYVIFLAFSLFVNVIPSVALIESNSESSQADIQLETAKAAEVPGPTDSQVYIKPESKDQKQILAKENRKQKTTTSLIKIVEKPQDDKYETHDIPLSETQSPLPNITEDPEKISAPAKTSVDAISLESSFPSRHELELNDYKQTENPPKIDKVSSSVKQVLSEKKDQAINGTGEFISEVGKSTSESFSELGKILNSEAREIKVDAKSNFSNMKLAYRKTTQALAKKLGRAKK